MDFEWDSAKAAANIRKHGVLFEEAVSALRDDLAATARLGALGGRVSIHYLRRLCQWTVACGFPHGARKSDSNYQRTFGDTHGKENI